MPTLNNNAYWLRVVVSPTNGEIAMAATDANKVATIMFNTGAGFAAPSTLTANSNTNGVRRVAVAYEQTSGDCLTAYIVNGSNNIQYRTATAGVLSGPATVIASSDVPDWVNLYPKSGSDEVLLLATNESDAFYARFWNGSSWGTTTTLSNSVATATPEKFGAVYQASNGTAMVVYGVTGSSTPNYRTYSAGAWSSVFTMPACSAEPKYIHLAAKPGTNELVCGVLDNNTHIRVYIWDGSSWISNLEVSTNATYITRRPFDVAYQPDGLNAMVVYSVNTGTPNYRTYAAGAWSAATSMSNMSNRPQYVQVVPGKTGGTLTIAIADGGQDLNVWKWTGSAMGTMNTLEANMGGSTAVEQFFTIGSSSSKPKIATWQQSNPGS